jgi:hypothetical protein
VDAIIGTHPHYVQALDFDPEAGTFVAYSLGDLLSDGENAGTEYGIVLDLEITKDHLTGQTRITNYSYTPIFTVTEKGRTPKVVRIHEAMEAYDELFLERIHDATYQSMAYALTRIEDRVQADEEE